MMYPRASQRTWALPSFDESSGHGIAIRTTTYALNPASQHAESQLIGGSLDRSRNQYGNTSQSRKQTRNQSQVLGSQIGDVESGGMSGKMGGITVQQSIEMKTYLADDTGSEKELITGPEGAYVGVRSGRATNIKSGGRRAVVEARAL